MKAPMRALVALSFVVLAIAGCAKPGAGAPRTWATQLANTYFDTRGDSAAIARMSQANDVETALTALRDALGAARTERIGYERIGFMLEYQPIWHADRLDQAQWDARRARIALLPDADVGQWRGSLATATGTQPSEMWTIGYLIDTPSLFKEGAYDGARSSLLMERLTKLSGEAVGLIAAPLHVDRAWAAMLIIQNDEMFKNGSDLDADKFAAAVAALGQVTAPAASGTATATTTAATQTSTQTTTTQPSQP